MIFALFTQSSSTGTSWREKVMIFVCIALFSVHCFIQCALLYSACIALFSVHCFIQCALLYSVCIALFSVPCFIQCALLYSVCIALFSVHCFIQCALLYSVCIALFSVHCFIHPEWHAVLLAHPGEHPVGVESRGQPGGPVLHHGTAGR